MATNYWYDFLNIATNAIMKNKKPMPPALAQLSLLAKLMDSQFKVPGTNIRFGLDALIGLVPGVGDMTTFGISSYMLWIMAQNGASGFVLARMVLNVLIDTVFGSVPVIGDIFDVAYKSNIKNLKLMQEHYVEGRHNGSAWKLIIPIMLILLLLMGAILYLLYISIAWAWHAMHS